MGGRRRWLAVGATGALAALAVFGRLHGSPLHGPVPRTGPPVAAGAVHSDLPVAPPVVATTTTARPEPASTTSAATSPVTTGRTTPSRPAPSTTRPAPPVPFPPGFDSAVAEIDAATAARLAASWRPGCPVPLRDLRLVTVTHWAFDGRPRPGELVVHAAHAEPIRRAFAELFAVQFPIEQVRLVDEFGGDDDRSMAANNTSAFNCRRVRGTARWSQHAYGGAIDINPVENPYVTRDGTVLPPAGREFLRRDASRQGVITSGGPVVAAFARIGWRWGGAWANPDYQHFSSNGR